MARRKPTAGHCLHCNVWRDHLHRDHIEPKWRGGTDTPDNYQFLCANCHEDKTYAERRTPEYRAMQSAGNRIRMMSAETRRKISEAVCRANAARQWTSEMRAKCSHKGRKHPPRTPEQRARMSAARIGMRLSDSHRAALSRSHVGKKWSEARRAAHDARRAAAQTKKAA